MGQLTNKELKSASVTKLGKTAISYDRIKQALANEIFDFKALNTTTICFIAPVSTIVDWVTSLIMIDALMIDTFELSYYTTVHC